MNALLKMLLGAAALSALAGGGLNAGQNAGGTARLGWLDSADNMKPGVDESSCTPKLGITVRGLTHFRGADVQLYIVDGYQSLPPSWQWWVDAGAGTQGCAAGHQTYTQGFKTTGAQLPADSIYNAFSQAPAVPGQATGQAGAEYYNLGPCLTPHGVALLWFSAAGTSGVVRNPTKTFGLFSLVMDQNPGCAGDCSNPAHMCINVQYRQPCSDPGNPRGSVIGVTDANNQYDYLPATQGFVTWYGPNPCCPGVSPIDAYTWGQLRKSYR